MKKYFTAALAALSLAACTQAPKNAYTITGTATDVDGLPVYLMQGRDTLAVDTIRNGQFSFSGVVENPDMVVAYTDRRHADTFFLEPGNIVIDLNHATATGTPLNDELQALDDFQTSLFQELQNGADGDSLVALLQARFREVCANHVGDRLGLYFTQQLAQDMSKEELDSVMALCDLYKSDAQLIALAESKSAQANTAVGCQYINVEGINAQSGASLSLADVVAEGKPVNVNVAGSW